jgi:hypothetical protein
MLKKYFKSIYNILKNYKNYDSNYLSNFIAINDCFIETLKSKSNINYDIKVGGNKKKTKKIILLSLQKGGVPDSHMQLIIALTNVLKKNINDLNLNPDQYKAAVDSLIKYINSLHALMPSDKNISALIRQMNELKTFLSSY